MAALLLCGTGSARVSKPHRPHASEPVSTPYYPAYRPDDQPEFPLTSEVDQSRVAPGIWDTPPELIGDSRVGVLTDDGVNRGFLFIGAYESRIGEEYLVLRCVAGSEYELRLVLEQPLLRTQAYRFEAAWTGSTRTLELGPADPETADSVLLAKADAAALFGNLLTGQKVQMTVSPLSSSGTMLGKSLTLNFDGAGVAEGWQRIDRCQP
ncbi:hypothetical protein E7T06_09100 [Deinococcus sp. Arct2-2]|uniref:hypothetical protein n=1 Tax=Deinococcus sp. Arct2-2 TaxID=2568653 RepID=UPI0010A40194|nr:hypothetical protein [Deinococcus sp. Arct2-2]THF70053.1 hypothetical protein E7T06_09100 [Deinococcus sp. Arct2-2]